MFRRFRFVLAALVGAAGCAAGGMGVGGTGLEGASPVVAGGASKVGVSISYLVPYSHNPDPTIYATSTSDFLSQLNSLTDAHVQPGVMGGVELAKELGPFWTMRLSAAIYSADTSVNYRITDYSDPLNPIVVKGVYRMDPIQGFPVFFDLEYGKPSRHRPTRLFWSMGGGYIWYGKSDDTTGQIEPPSDEGLARVSVGAETFGMQGVDVRLELGHVWLFKNLRHQWMGGLSIAYAF